MEQWLTTGDLGVVFGCTSGNVLKTIVPHVKAEHCRREKGRNKYRVDAVVAAYLAWRVRQPERAPGFSARESVQQPEPQAPGGPPGPPARGPQPVSRAQPVLPVQVVRVVWGRQPRISLAPEGV